MSARVAALFVAGLISLACSSSGLKGGGSTAGAGGAVKGGQADSFIGSGTTGGMGGTIRTGGAGAARTGGAGSGAGGTSNAGGVGGSGTAGASGSAGGTGGCSRGDCHMPACAGEFEPNPDPCGCAVICVLNPDAGVAKDTGGPDYPTYCELIDCPIERPCSIGYARSTDPCGCPICVFPDAGVASDAGGPDSLPICPIGCPVMTCPRQCIPLSTVDSGTATDVGKPDTPVICNVMCPMMACTYGYLPNPTPCGCSSCAPPPDRLAGLVGAVHASR